MPTLAHINHLRCLLPRAWVNPSRAVFFLFTLLLCLNGCSSLSKRHIEPPEIASLPQYWQCSGKLSLTAIHPQTQETLQQVLSYEWQQAGENLLLKLAGTLGFGRITIEQNSQGARILRGDTVLSQANTLDALLWDQTGIELPTHFLRYWILGRPAPSVAYHTASSDTSSYFISGFNQQGWQIRYLRSQPVDAFQLPARINATNGDVQLKIAITRWQLAHGDAP